MLVPSKQDQFHNIAPLFIAIKSGNLEIVTILLHSGCFDVSAFDAETGHTPLTAALEQVKLLAKNNSSF